MTRTWSIVLGIGLVVLGLAGLSSAGSTWIAWLDIAGGILSFVLAGSAPVAAVGNLGHGQYRDARGILFICAGLFAMWIIGLATKSVTVAMAWWNFGFACAYGLLAIGASRGRSVISRIPTIDEREQQGPRRVA
jgi:membrane-bound metal-dependent hydrolase YbcI (DUF457 family)